MLYITTFSEQKHRGVPTPIQRSRKPMPLEITTFRVAFVHTHYKLAYNMRDLIYSSLMIYPTLKIFRLVLAFRNPLLVSYLNPLSPKVSNQTNNGLLNYYNSDYNYKYYFFIVLFLSLYLY